MTVPEAMAPWLIALAVVLAVGAATLAAAEAAVGRLTRAEALRLDTEGRRGAEAVRELVADPAPALSTSTLVRGVAEAAAAVAAYAAASTWTRHWWAALLVTALVMGAVIFTVLGVSPRTVGRQHAEAVALRTAPGLRALTLFLGPVARLLVGVANALTPGRGYRDGPFSTEGELRELVDRASESAIIEQQERDLIHSVFELGETYVREVMSPRTDMVTVPGTASAREALTTFIASGHSRLPVVGESMDDVLGVLMLKDVARAALGDRRIAAAPARNLARPAVFVPETKLVDALLREMQASSAHLALVVDEYGGVAGLVTLEDLLEEIVGEISDEHDIEVPDVIPLADGAFRVSSRLPVDELGELFGVLLEDDDVDSVGGLLAKALGTVPVSGSHAVIGDLALTAEGVEGHRITTVRVYRVDQDADGADADARASLTVPSPAAGDPSEQGSREAGSGRRHERGSDRGSDRRGATVVTPDGLQEADDRART